MAKISFVSGPDSGGGDFPVIPQGDYLCEIQRVEEAKSSNDNPQYRIKLRVAEGPSADVVVTDFVTVTPKSAWRLRQIFEAAGCTVVSKGKDADGNELFDADTDELLGKYVTVAARQETYNQKLSNKFDKYRTPKVSGSSGASAPQGAAAPAQSGGAKPPQGAKPPPFAR